MSGRVDNSTPLYEVIRNTFGKEVYKIDTEDIRDMDLVQDLLVALAQVKQAMIKEPIQSRRPNEVGN